MELGAAVAEQYAEQLFDEDGVESAEVRTGHKGPYVHCLCADTTTRDRLYPMISQMPVWVELEVRNV